LTRRCLALATLVLRFAAAATAADTGERLKEVQKKIEDTKKEAKSIEEKTQGALGEMDRLDRSISDRERRVAALAADIRAAKTIRTTTGLGLIRITKMF